MIICGLWFELSCQSLLYLCKFSASEVVRDLGVLSDQTVIAEFTFCNQIALSLFGGKCMNSKLLSNCLVSTLSVSLMTAKRSKNALRNQKL